VGIIGGFTDRDRRGRCEEGEEPVSEEPIVVGTDGSSTADRAVDKAGELAAALGVPLHVVMSYHAVTGGASLAAASGVVIDPVAANEGVDAHAKSVVAGATDRLLDAGVKVSGHVCAGEPAETLIAVARDVGAQMIVVGNRGMLGARRVLGSVPNRVSHHAPCCVLIVQTC
jgi:nucleotide-binding universal stress UspA family protein